MPPLFGSRRRCGRNQAGGLPGAPAEDVFDRRPLVVVRAREYLGHRSLCRGIGERACALCLPSGCLPRRDGSDPGKRLSAVLSQSGPSGYDAIRDMTCRASVVRPEGWRIAASSATPDGSWSGAGRPAWRN